ncbi:MAG TPA: helix-turn-helix transcriptional regulator [Polyangiaceae bacterium]|jgi:transcriptional regulator with XRE-family HTH domain
MSKPRALFLNQPAGPLLARAHRTLGMTQGQLGNALGVSERTVSRWYQRGPSVTVRQFCKLAALVYPRDPALARELAEAASETLESLGLVAPAPVVPASAPAPAPPPVPVAVLIDAVVCAAAEALDLSPGRVRSAVRAAFRRARELHLTIEQVDAALEPPPAAIAPVRSVP